MTKTQRILAMLVTWAAIGFIVGLLIQGLVGCAASDPAAYYRQQWSDPNIEQHLNHAIQQEKQNARPDKFL